MGSGMTVTGGAKSRSGEPQGQRTGYVMREVAMRVVCPRCGAAGGEPCHGRRRERRSCHAERHAQAREAA